MIDRNFSKIKTQKRKIELFKEIPIVWIRCTSNNCLLTLTDSRGATLAWSSGGVCGFKNSRKSTSHAAEMAAIDLSEKVFAKGFKCISIKMKGLGRGKKRVVSALSRCGLFIEKITEDLSIGFNGCRQKRKRRT